MSICDLEKVYLNHFTKLDGQYIYSYAPGRMNFIGEHVDYLGGCVVPAALSMGTHVLMTAEPSDKWKFSLSSDLIESGKVCTTCFEDKDSMSIDKSFRTVIFGCAYRAWELCKCDANPEIKNKPMHMKAIVKGMVPIGVGMSSSTSVCIAIVQAFVQYFSPVHAKLMQKKDRTQEEEVELAKFKKELILAASAVERHHCGVNGGLMDQYTSLFGKLNTFLKIDCSVLEHINVSFPDAKLAEYEVMLINSMRPHDLGDAYNKIRKDMEDGENNITEYLRSQDKDGSLVKCIPGWTKDVRLKLKMLPFTNINGVPSVEWMKEMHRKGVLSDGQYDRSSYAVEEMERTDRFVDFTKDPELIKNPKEMLRRMGKLMNETQEGLSKKLKVSTKELDLICKTMCSLPGTYGARLMGGGFGGCVIAMVDKTKFTPNVKQQLFDGFKKAFPDLGECEIYNSSIGFGAFVQKITKGM